jgi:hypothetical protein
MLITTLKDGWEANSSQPIPRSITDKGKDNAEQKG